MLLNQACAFLDIETTGTHANSEGITEIGLRLVDTTGEVISWQQLINPGRSIPGYIQQLTGISNAMVEDQPYFEDIASELVELLDSAIFVAHNARFDYSFIKKGLEQCGYPFRPKVICTVKLSRALYPEHRHHNLDAICQRMGYARNESHRALADVDAMLAFIQHAIAEHGLTKVNLAAQNQLQRPSQPTHLDMSVVDALPNTPGVYRFYDEAGALLYVGKSVRLRERVKSHFSADLTNSKEMRLSQEIRSIDHTETLGELGALLLENREIKTLNPIYNRRQRRYKKLWSYELHETTSGDFKGALSAKLCEKPLQEKNNHSSQQQNSVARFDHQLYGLYTSKGAAEKWFREIIAKNSLCKKVMGIEKGKGACFNYQIKRCLGACVKKIDIDTHNAKLTKAMAANTVLAWPFDEPIVIAEENSDWRESESALVVYHLIDQWVHLGTASNQEELATLVNNPSDITFDRESYRFINKFIHLGIPLSELTEAYSEID